LEVILAVLLIFGGGTLVALAMSPVGRAIAARIQHAGPVREGDDLRRLQEGHQAVLQELETVRQELTELQERLDFAERLLARKREDPAFPQPPDRP